MSQRYKRFSRDREGFHQLTHKTSDEIMNSSSNDPNPNDVTIDIPLTQVTSKNTGARKPTDLSTHSVRPSNDSSEATQIANEKSAHPHLRRYAGRRRRLEQRGKEASDPQDGTVTAMGRFYSKIYNFSIVTRYMLYVAPLALVIAVPIIVGATAAPNARIGGRKIVWFFTWIEVIWCSLWVSKLVAHFLPFLFQFVVGVISSGTRKYSLILAALEIPLSLVGWSVTSLATFVPLMTLNPDARSAEGGKSLKDWEKIVKNILFACVFCTLLLLVEKVLIQLISISYHRKQFDDKIKSSKRNIHLVTLLYEASRALFPAYCPEFAEEDYIISDILGIDGFGSRGDKFHRHSGSVTPMRLIQNVQRVGDKVTAAFGNVAQEITGKQVFNPTAAHSIVIQALEKKRSSEALARRLWLSFVLEGKDALYPEDIQDVLGSERETEAVEAFDCLDADGNGDISLDEMVLRVDEFGRDRASLANSMRDVDQAICVLDNLLMAVVFVGAVFIFIAWLNTNFTTTLATAGTALLSLSFVFSVTAQELLGSCIFIFVKHPYDVGDRVDIGGDQLVVEKISLLYTMFRKVKDYKRTQVPNIVLNSLWIDNVSRSKAMREQVSLFISFDTTLEDVELLRKEMQAFVLAKDNSRDFQPDIDIEVLGLAEMNKMELKIEIRHKSNWANETVRAARRSKFMCALVLALKKVPIYAPGGGGAAAGDKANPTYSVAITDTEAQANKETFASDKESKRMVPTTKASGTEESPGKSTSIDFFATTHAGSREGQTAQQLNQRHPLSDPARDGFDKVVEEEDDEDVLAHKRATDLEEVKNILRRQSTTGRRKAAPTTRLSPVARQGVASQGVASQGMTSSNQTYDADLSLPGSNGQTVPPRVSYYEDNPFQPQTQHASPMDPARTQLYPTSTHSPTYRTRSASNADHNLYQGMDQTTSSYIPGNAFSQQPSTFQPSPPSPPPRRPVPGMGEMKEHLQTQQGGSQR